MPEKTESDYRREKLTIAASEFIALFTSWLVLSGRFQLKYISLGVLSAALVTFLTNDIFSSIFYRKDSEKTGTLVAFLKFLRFLAYIPWLLYKIIKANIQVASIVLHPKLPIDPALLQFETKLKRDVAQVILATSITLTPGTVTIKLESGKFIIHALVRASARDLIEAKMQNKVGEIFMEEKEEPPDLLWAHSIEELA